LLFLPISSPHGQADGCLGMARSPPQCSYGLTPWSPPEAVRGALPYAEEPNLCARIAAQQTCGGGIIIAGDLIRSRLNIDSHKLAIVSHLKVGTNITLIDGLAPLGKLFFAVTWFQHGHGLTPQTRETGAK